jgi:pimeloyl-ACP methyl ester carboxylesterase
MGFRRFRRRFAVIVFMGTLVILTVLIGMGFIFTVPRKVRETDYRAAVGAQEPRSYLSVDSVRLSYTDSGGDGPVLLCLHAIGHGARDFEDLSRRLSPQYRVIALDFPSQGNSGPDYQPASGTRYAELLDAFIQQLNLKSITLLGNSIGGAAAIRYTQSHPNRVRALVLCDSGGMGPPDRMGRIFIGIFVQFFAAGRRGAIWYPWAFERYYRKVLKQYPAREERERIARSAYEIAPVLEQAWKSFGEQNENLLPILHEIRCPVFLAWAKDDFVLPLKLNEKAFEQFPDHHLEVFEGGHAAFLEDPVRFEESLRAFLGGLGACTAKTG